MNTIYVLYILQNGTWNIESRYKFANLAAQKMEMYIASGMSPDTLRIEEEKEDR